MRFTKVRVAWRLDVAGASGLWKTSFLQYVTEDVR